MDRLSKILYRINEVWGEKQDFRELGFEYVAFVIRQDVNDMESDDWDEEECIEELADVCINSIRKIEDEGYEPYEVIMDRLDEHENKDVDEIEEKYREMFKNR